MVEIYNLVCSWFWGGISSSVLSVFFTDNCYKLLKSLHLIGWEQICQWKTLTKRLMKCPPGSRPESKTPHETSCSYILTNFYIFKGEDNVRIKIYCQLYQKYKKEYKKSTICFLSSRDLFLLDQQSKLIWIIGSEMPTSTFLPYFVRFLKENTAVRFFPPKYVF